MRISDWSSDVCSSDLPGSGCGCKRSPRRHWRVARIIVEAPPGLAAVPAGVDIFDEQRCGAELGVAGAVEQHLGDLQARIEPDEIGERERPHRVVEADRKSTRLKSSN